MSLFKIITRKEAKLQGLKRFFIGKPCKKHGHIAEQYVTGGCVECSVTWMRTRKEKEQERRATDPEYVKRQNVRAARAATRRYWADPEKARAYQQEYLSRPGNRKKGQQARMRYYRRTQAKKLKLRQEKEKAHAAVTPGYISCKDAKARGLIQFFTGHPCVHGHTSPRLVSNGTCRACLKVKRAAETPEDRAKKARWYKGWAIDNRDHLRVRALRNSRLPLGQLRSSCAKAAKSMQLLNLDYSKLDLLYYDFEEFRAHLESTLPDGMTIEGAQEAGYHLDHIIPLSFISEALPGGEAGGTLGFRVAMDLRNLRMIPGAENLRKRNRLDLDPEQYGVFQHLCEKYKVTRELAAQAIPY